jgi:hypothetical protein
VAHLHRSLGHPHNKFQDHEVEYAKELLRAYSEVDVRDLIAYAVEKVKASKTDMLYFGGLKAYRDRWSADRSRRATRNRQAEATRACPFCNEVGMLELRKNGTGEFFVTPCPHQQERVADIERRQNASRI